MNIDEEWRMFLTSQTHLCESTENKENRNRREEQKKREEKTPIRSCSFVPNYVSPEPVMVLSKVVEDVVLLEDVIDGDTEDVEPDDACEELYISTKTKVVFLNQEIDIHTIFWNIPVIDYWQPKDGVVKKQIKIVSHSQEELDGYREKLKNIPYYTENIIKEINNPNARKIKFKDERKITIGVSKKDIMNCRGKVKNAFYNCFAVIFRFQYEGIFREIHVKVFNTGKMEIPGVINVALLDIVKRKILELIQPFCEKPIHFIENEGFDNVLINSNFNCGFYINREVLHHILTQKYGIETSYDPCSYPGVKCKFYFNNEGEFDEETQNGVIHAIDRTMKMSELIDNKKYTEVSFMIFRTGSCLIVGNCSEQILMFIFQFIKKILLNEYLTIRAEKDEKSLKHKKIKMRKKTISLTHSYFQSLSIPKESLSIPMIRV